MRGLRAKRVRTIKGGTLIVTIDIGMASNTGYCATADGRDIKPLSLATPEKASIRSGI